MSRRMPGDPPGHESVEAHGAATGRVPTRLRVSAGRVTGQFLTASPALTRGKAFRLAPLRPIAALKLPTAQSRLLCWVPVIPVTVTCSLLSR